MNNYEKYELQKHSSMKNPSRLFSKMNFNNETLITRMKNKNHHWTTDKNRNPLEFRQKIKN